MTCVGIRARRDLQDLSREQTSKFLAGMSSDNRSNTLSMEAVGFFAVSTD